MKYVTEYRSGEDAQRIAAEIRAEVKPDRFYRFMEFCGGHTHVLARWGLTDLLPENVRMIHGPGCPVCVLPIARIDMAMQLALTQNVILCTYADTMRVPAGHGMSLFKAKAQGADIRMIYSPLDALKIARENPERQVVFFAIGFETTTPPTAAALLTAKKEGLKNFSVFCNHVLTPAAMLHILRSAKERPQAPVLDGLVGPAHVSTVIGWKPYEQFPRDWHLPVVVCGFEPVDMMMTILMLVRQVNDGRAEVENEFTRAVTENGNQTAIRLMDMVFETREKFEWRGLGWVPRSALKLKDAFADFDAEKRFAMVEHPTPDNKACECGAILRGEKTPAQCPLFGKVCNPSHPIGACMVSSEGACAAAFSYERRRAVPRA
jgi:hydrogenase expression/formation protein HypD